MNAATLEKTILMAAGYRTIVKVLNGKLETGDPPLALIRMTVDAVEEKLAEADKRTPDLRDVLLP